MEIPLDQREKVKALFDAALRLDPAARSAFLAHNCSEDDVRRVVEELLLSYDQAGSFLSHSPLSLHSPASLSSPKTFVPGEVLASRFRVTRFIAKGGVGEVYEAEDMELRQQVALKTIRPDVLEQPHVLDRFKREVCLAKAVTHPNICRIFDLFRHQSSPQVEASIFISMELLRGETLSDRLRRVGAMSTVEALPIIIQMTSALAAAHGVGIVHRDFKPGNVMLVNSDGSESVRVVVTDFGMAFRSTDEFSVDLTPPGRVIGTPEWMSPEQIEGREITASSDIYSLGLVVYRMITGVHPFEAESSVSCALKRLSEKPLPPRNLVPGLSAQWEAVILKCLERNPGHRFVDMLEVEETLQGKTTSSFPRLLRRSSRKMKMAIAGMAFLFLIASIGYFARSRIIPGKQTPSEWQLQTIQGGLGPGKTAIWQNGWNDISWIGPEGWLCAELDTGGGGGDIGRGVLLHTKDGGASWTEVNGEKFNSGHGTFPWGPHGTYVYSWQDIGPIYTIKAFSRHLGGGNRRVEIWLAATSGIYTSNDDGETWQRSTPRPDDRRQPNIYAHFYNIVQGEGFIDVYATGWEGIAHWSSSTKHWQLEFPTYSYSISGIDIEPGYPYREIWAVGQSVQGQPYASIYHLRQPEQVWERLSATGSGLEPLQSLSDVRIIDLNTGFAVGQKGLILQGSKSKDGIWAWTTIPSPTKESLNSIEYVNGTLWIVGDKGVVLNSGDLGKTWTVTFLKDESGRAPEHLRRIRAFAPDSFWIVGHGVVYKHMTNR